MLSKPRIVCAALRNTKTGLIITSPRHYDMICHAIIKSLKPEEWCGLSEVEQGFVDQHRNFYDRKQAWVIAKDNGQIWRDCGVDGTLFSENLY